jgi:hypothetical protein
VITLQPQEIPFCHPDSCNLFITSSAKPFVATPAAIELYGLETILACLVHLQTKAKEHSGLDYVLVFTDSDRLETLWFMEDGEGGAITALLPSDL